MRWVRFFTCLTTLLVILSVSAKQSDAEDRWSVKKLWPDRQAISRGTKTLAQKTSQPSMIERLTSGSRTLWDRTKALATPSTSNKKTNNKRQRRSTSVRNRSKKPSALQRIFGQGEPGPSPKTITDFFKQDRPG